MPGQFSCHWSLHIAINWSVILPLYAQRSRQARGEFPGAVLRRQSAYRLLRPTCLMSPTGPWLQRRFATGGSFRDKTDMDSPCLAFAADHSKRTENYSDGYSLTRPKVERVSLADHASRLGLSTPQGLELRARHTVQSKRSREQTDKAATTHLSNAASYG